MPLDEHRATATINIRKILVKFGYVVS